MCQQECFDDLLCNFWTWTYRKECFLFENKTDNGMLYEGVFSGGKKCLGK